MSPFLKTSRFRAVVSGLGNSRVEGIIWKNAVPKAITHAIESFNWQQILGRIGNGYSHGRDLWQQETVIHKSLSDDYPELTCIDQHTQEIQQHFKTNNTCVIPKSRGDQVACHFASAAPLSLSNQVAHIDSPQPQKVYSGRLGAEWRMCATPNNYPAYKVLATLSSSSNIATALVPYEDRGAEDPENPGHFPSANKTHAEYAEPGDIVILKQCVTVHYGPQGIEKRWVTVY